MKKTFKGAEIGYQAIEKVVDTAFVQFASMDETKDLYEQLDEPETQVIFDGVSERMEDEEFSVWANDNHDHNVTCIVLEMFPKALAEIRYQAIQIIEDRTATNKEN